MEVKTLQPAEWDILKQAPDGWVPDPAWVAAIVAMDGERLVGRAAVCLMAHIEGTWVAEDHRNGTVGFRLIKAIEEQARAMNLSIVMAYAMPEVGSYLERLGFKKSEVSVYVKEVDPCQP